MHLIRLLSTKLVGLRKKTIAIWIFIFVTFSSTVAYALEPDTFGNWFNALYWVLTTMATVGYGDYFAKTMEGNYLRFSSIFLGLVC
ncbi:potassium channel family protein [Paenibacillus sp. GCM10027627]|uniref:potassium channel family protein n=1 Tax=unclassified Paenibacillus TaxID=185978 RepID=UPI003631FE70